MGAPRGGAVNAQGHSGFGVETLRAALGVPSFPLASI